MTNKTETIISPIVECRYAHIKHPDREFSSSGIYQIDLLFDRQNPEHREFVSMLQKLRPSNAKNNVWKLDSKDDPYVVVKCKQNARVQDRTGKVYEGFQPIVYDSKGQRINDIPLFGNGTKVRVRIEPRPYTLQGGGVRLRPVAIQIVELVPYEEQSENEKPASDSMGFDAVEGSFVAQSDGFRDETQGGGDDMPPAAAPQQAPAMDDYAGFDDGAQAPDFEDF